MNKQELEYFKTHWKPRWDNKKYSGWALLDKFKPTDNILDIGCGGNPLKEKLGDRVYGIDPAGLGLTDEAVAIEDFEPRVQNVRCVFQSKDNSLDVTVFYNIKNGLSNQELQFTVNRTR